MTIETMGRRQPAAAALCNASLHVTIHEGFLIDEIDMDMMMNL